MKFALIIGLSIVASAQSFYAGGLTAQPQSSPKPSGWAALAVEASSKAQLWSISEMDFTLVAGKVQSSVRTGIATPLRTIGTVTIYGLGDAGTSTTGSASGSAFAGGGIAIIPVGRKGLQAVAGVRILKTAVGGTQTLVEIGFGKAMK